MEARLFRMFREQTGLSPVQANRLFESQGVWEFIEDCYESLHLSSDEAALSDINRMLAFRGVVL